MGIPTLCTTKNAVPIIVVKDTLSAAAKRIHRARHGDLRCAPGLGTFGSPAS